MSASHIFRIPNDLLIKIFGFLPEYGFLWADEDIPLSACLPYPLSDEDRNSDPKQGARVMPYLPQVSKHWRDLSKLRDTKALLNRHVVIDFGHELMNGIYYPLRVQSGPMSDQEFVDRLEVSFLPAFKIHRHIQDLKSYIRMITINVEGLWHPVLDGDMPVGESVQFDESDLCFILGCLSDRLQEFNFHNRYGRIRLDLIRGVWSSLSRCSELRKVSLHGVGSPTSTVPEGFLMDLAHLQNLQELQIYNYTSAAIRDVPDQWSTLTRLSTLGLSFQHTHVTLPAWLHALPLRQLNLSAYLTGMIHDGVDPPTHSCYGNLLPILQLTSLVVLSLQGMALSDRIGQEPLFVAASMRRLFIPDLSPLAPNLRLLSLSGNCFTRIPPHIFRLTNLEILDLHDNRKMWVLGPLGPFLGLFPSLRLLDLRSVHPWRYASEPQPYRYSRASLVDKLPWITSGLCDVLYGCETVASDSDDPTLALDPTEVKEPRTEEKEPESSPLVNSLSASPLQAAYPLKSVSAVEEETDVQNECTITSEYTVNGTPEHQMRGFMEHAKLLLESRPKWLPPTSSLSDAADQEEGSDCWGMPKLKWRQSSAGVKKHGNGPWLLLSKGIPDQE